MTIGNGTVSLTGSLLKLSPDKERAVIFKALTGSHNYNLATETSDRDYKVFYMPDFNDLYENHNLPVTEIIGPKEDYSFQDIRKLTSLIWKSNISFIEPLFSVEMDINPVFYDFVQYLLSKRDELSRINLPYLFDSTMGIFGRVEKSRWTEYDDQRSTCCDSKKTAMVIRLLDFLDRFYRTDFSDFKSAFTYSGIEREKLLNIKNGLWTNKEVQKRLEMSLARVREIENDYKRRPPNNDLHFELESTLKELVRKHI